MGLFESVTGEQVDQLPRRLSRAHRRRALRAHQMSDGSARCRCECRMGHVIDHFGIICADYEKSKKFYDAVLGVLGYARQMDVGPGRRIRRSGKPDFWVEDASGRQVGAPSTSRSRPADATASRAFHDAALGSGRSRCTSRGSSPSTTRATSGRSSAIPTATTSKPCSTEARRRRPRARRRAGRAAERLGVIVPQRRPAAVGRGGSGGARQCPSRRAARRARQADVPAAAFIAAGSRWRMVCSSVSRQPDPVGCRRQRTRILAPPVHQFVRRVDRQHLAVDGVVARFSRTRRAPGRVEAASGTTVTSAPAVPGR